MGEGTITDLDGKFSIGVTSQTQLEISYIGYKTQTLMVGDLGVMTVKMESDNEMLDEVVVIGAGTQKKVSVTGSIATVKGATLKLPSSSLTSSSWQENYRVSFLLPIAVSRVLLLTFIFVVSILSADVPLR